MSPFEFVCAFYSVVLGVAVAQLMTSVGRLIVVRDQVRTLAALTANRRFHAAFAIFALAAVALALLTDPTRIQ